ncbi:MAG: ASCH domain-containing protein [Chloroflexota bacterium]
MIFAHTLDKILCGEKRQTRRLVKPNEELFQADLPVYVKSGKRTVYQVGKSYAVQPNRGKKSVARIVLTGLRKESVKAISTEDALAEGFLSREDFFATWRTIHGKDADLQREVWVLEFSLQVIIADELKELYEQYLSKNRSVDNRYDLSASVTGIPGDNLHSRYHKVG